MPYTSNNQESNLGICLAFEFLTLGLSLNLFSLRVHEELFRKGSSSPSQRDSLSGSRNSFRSQGTVLVLMMSSPTIRDKEIHRNQVFNPLIPWNETQVICFYNIFQVLGSQMCTTPPHLMQSFALENILNPIKVQHTKKVKSAH